MLRKLTARLQHHTTAATNGHLIFQKKILFVFLILAISVTTTTMHALRLTTSSHHQPPRRRLNTTPSHHHHTATIHRPPRSIYLFRNQFNITVSPKKVPQPCKLTRYPHTGPHITPPSLDSRQILENSNVLKTGTFAVISGGKHRNGLIPCPEKGCNSSEC